jgi:hypothetical protein
MRRALAWLHAGIIQTFLAEHGLTNDRRTIA